MTIIEKIRAEVERLKKEGEKGNTLAQANNDYESHLQWEQQIAVANRLLSKLSILSDLEKEEKPSEGFDGEFSKFSNDVDAEHPFPICVDEFKDFARHFYELGRQIKPKVSEDVETEALRSAGVLLSEHFEDEEDDAIRTTALRCWKGGVIHGASWQREQMMKEAVEGYISATNEVSAVLALPKGDFKKGDKVKLIIVKEDTK